MLLLLTSLLPSPGRMHNKEVKVIPRKSCQPEGSLTNQPVAGHRSPVTLPRVLWAPTCSSPFRGRLCPLPACWAWGDSVRPSSCETDSQSSRCVRQSPTQGELRSVSCIPNGVATVPKGQKWVVDITLACDPLKRNPTYQVLLLAISSLPLGSV